MTMTDFYREAARPPAGSTLDGPPGPHQVPQYEGWDPAGDGGPDCPFCGKEMTSTECRRDECPGEVLQCEVITFHGSRNQDSPMFGPDEQCENDVEPGSTVCAEHAYVVDEPSFAAEARGD
jgi:hypothetical protein